MQANIGRLLCTIFTSSTCCGDQSSDLWSSLLTTALFRNLRLSVFWVSMFSMALVFASSSCTVIGVGGQGLWPCSRWHCLYFCYFCLDKSRVWKLTEPGKFHERSVLYRNRETRTRAVVEPRIHMKHLLMVKASEILQDLGKSLEWSTVS